MLPEQRFNKFEKFILTLMCLFAIIGAGLFGHALDTQHTRKLAVESNCTTDMECYEATGVNY